VTRAYDDEAMKPLGPRLEPPPPWWRKWMLLAIFAAKRGRRAGAEIAAGVRNFALQKAQS